MPEKQLISVVVPMYNEGGNVRKLYDGLAAVLEQLWYDFEIVFVDDGSTDQTLAILEDLSAAHRRVKVVSLSRNFGTQLAILAGLDHAGGDAVIVMDGDLQHPPALIPEMIARWEEGYEVVCATRTKANGGGLRKRVGAYVFAQLLKRLLPFAFDPQASDFRLLDRKVVNAVVRMRERHRFFRILVTWAGYRQAKVPFAAADRYWGETKYGLRKLTALAVDAIVSSSVLPLRLCTFLGLAAAFSGFCYAFWAVYVRLFTERYIPGWAAIVVAVLFLGGVQLICLGLLGEYVGRIYEEIKRRPLYLVRQQHGFHAHSEFEQPDDRRSDGAPVEEPERAAAGSDARPVAPRIARLH